MLAIYLDEVKPAHFYFAKEFIENRIYYFDNLDIPHVIFTNLQEYLQSSADKKIAVLYNNFTHGPARATFFEKFNSIELQSDLIFLVETENHAPEVLNFHANSKVILVLPAPLNDNSKDKKTILNPLWFEITLLLYKQIPHELQLLDPYNSKPKFFEALLGVGKPHRDVVYEFFLENNLLEKNIISYYLRDPHNQEKNTEFIPVAGAIRTYRSDKDSAIITGSDTRVIYSGVRTHLACIIPKDVYNQTAYSIVAETNPNNDFHLFSEKIVKPILAKRLFIVFSGRGYLSSLRKAGFRTFDGIINESYDKELDNIKRWSMAAEQIKFLCNQNQKDILPKIRNIVDHNFKIITETDWTGLAIDQMISKIKNLTN